MSPIEELQARLLAWSINLSDEQRAAYAIRSAAYLAAVNARGLLESQALEAERRAHELGCLPSAHPGRALEAGLLAQAALLRSQADAVQIPRAPW